MKYNDADKTNEGLLDVLLNASVTFIRPFVKLGAGVSGALMLSQILQHTQESDNPEGWFNKTRRQFKKDLGLSYHEQYTAKNKLKALGILEVERKGLPSKICYRVNMKNLETCLENAQDDKKKTLNKGNIGHE